MDGVKSWLSKSKGSAKNLSDEGSLKSSRLVDARLRPPAKMAAGSEEKAHFSPERSTVGGASVPVLTPLARPERFHTFICPFSCFFSPKTF